MRNLFKQDFKRLKHMITSNCRYKKSPIVRTNNKLFLTNGLFLTFNMPK